MPCPVVLFTLGEVRFHVMDIQVALWRGICGKKLRFPANSHHQLANHVSGSSLAPGKPLHDVNLRRLQDSLLRRQPGSELPSQAIP